MLRESFTLAIAIGLLAMMPLHAEVRPNSLFADNAVLQRGRVVPVWGTARDGEPISVDFAGQHVSTVAAQGTWRVTLKALPANAQPQTMTLRGDNTVILKNILVGDVWVASGQSNMARHLGLRAGQKPIENWEAEVAAANYPMIREYYVPEHLAYAVTADADGNWRVCSPQTVADFSAVGYFFARDVHLAEKVPIGVLFSAWGGTVAEAWTSEKALKTMPDFADELARVEQTAGDPESIHDNDQQEHLNRWYAENDSAESHWTLRAFMANDWNTMQLPSAWETSVLPNHDGIVWFHKEIELPSDWENRDAVLHLGTVDDDDTTWINGVQVGATEGWDIPRTYKIAKGVLKAGRNAITIRVLDTYGPGGFVGRPSDMYLDAIEGSPLEPIQLAGEWRFRGTTPLEDASAVPPSRSNNQNLPTVLYNAMIAPLQSFPIKGVIWYQGEQNNGRASQYRELFSLLISDWRRAWHWGDFPFLFVQIAPYRYMRPELREAQLLTLKKSPNTAMAVIVDAGDAADIHPTRKAPVGERLALAARALAYGEHIEYSGPLFKSVAFMDGKAIVSFTHVGSGLVARGGELKGFVIAGVDKRFVPAQAKIEDETVVVSSDQVLAPTAVRYGWVNVPDVNLFNAEGLPASPFRSDVQ